MIMASDRVHLEDFPMSGGVPSSQPKVALAPFIADCPGVITLGVRPTLAAYRSDELALLRRAVKVYFPTRHVSSWDYCSVWPRPLYCFTSSARPGPLPVH